MVSEDVDWRHLVPKDWNSGSADKIFGGKVAPVSGYQPAMSGLCHL